MESLQQALNSVQWNPDVEQNESVIQDILSYADDTSESDEASFKFICTSWSLLRANVVHLCFDMNVDEIGALVLASHAKAEVRDINMDSEKLNYCKATFRALEANDGTMRTVFTEWLRHTSNVFVGQVATPLIIDRFKKLPKRIVKATSWNAAELDADSCALVLECLNEVVHYLLKVLDNVRHLCNELLDDDRKSVERVVQDPTLLAQRVFCTDSVRRALLCYFLYEFDSFARLQHSNAESGEEEDEDMGVQQQQHLHAMAAHCEQLHRLGVVVLCEQILSEILFHRVDAYVSEKCQDNNEVALLQECELWFDECVCRWLSIVLEPTYVDGESSGRLPTIYAHWCTRLRFHFYETFANARIHELMNIVRDYPATSPAIHDLRTCLTHTKQHTKVVSALVEQYKTRLLQPGASTSDIVTQYVNTIKAMRELEPAGVMLEHVGKPVREYLRQRPDTIRCIAMGFTDDSNELFEEFNKGDVRYDDGGESSEENDNLESSWVPDPLDADPTSSQSKRNFDIISMLVGIFGSSEKFVTEYEKLLSERLLRIVDYNIEEELRNLEMLKLRFGEASLQKCTIMVKDVTDSKRINAFVHTKDNDEDKDKEDTKEESDVQHVSATMLSHLFWPSLAAQKMNVPPFVADELDHYAQRYSTFKVDVHQLAHEVGVSNLSDIRAKMAFFSNRHVVSEVERDTWQVNTAVQHTALVATSGEDDANTHTHTQAEVGDDAKDDDGGFDDEQVATYKKYIVAMLTNIGALNAERINTMLANFVSGYDVGVPQLKALLQRLVREDMLAVSGSGVYTLNKA